MRLLSILVFVASLFISVAYASDYKGKDLRGSDFTEYSLPNIDFSESNLSHVYFTESFLGGSKFVNANLYGAKFWGANIYMADFSGANLNGAWFGNTDMRYMIIDDETTLNGSSYNKATLLPLSFGETNARRRIEASRRGMLPIRED